MKKSLLFIVLAMALFSFSAWAAQETNTVSGKELEINEVHIEFKTASTKFYIYGRNFNNGNPPVVTLANYTLDVISSSKDEIIAELNAVDLEGDYLLTVVTGKADRKKDSYNLTIGAVGPPFDVTQSSEFNALQNRVSRLEFKISALESLLQNIDNDKDGYNASVDCNDRNADVYPGAQELCDGIDNNCNGQTDEECLSCIVGSPCGTDDYPVAGQCQRGHYDSECNCVGAIGPSPEICDLIDNDCNGMVDDEIVCNLK